MTAQESIDRFNACWPFVLAQECPYPDHWNNPSNFSNDRHDPGGQTMCGIIQREYDSYRKRHGLVVQDVRNLTREEGRDIYTNEYWKPHCSSLQAGLDLSFFDASVNEGCHGATKLLQHALSITVDGLWGSQTAVAVSIIHDVPGIIRRFAELRENFYRSLTTFRYFGDDWIRRTREIKTHSLAMVIAK